MNKIYTDIIKKDVANIAFLCTDNEEAEAMKKILSKFNKIGCIVNLSDNLIGDSMFDLPIKDLYDLILKITKIENNADSSYYQILLKYSLDVIYSTMKTPDLLMLVNLLSGNSQGRKIVMEFSRLSSDTEVKAKERALICTWLLNNHMLENTLNIKQELFYRLSSIIYRDNISNLFNSTTSKKHHVNDEKYIILDNELCDIDKIESFDFIEEEKCLTIDENLCGYNYEDRKDDDKNIINCMEEIKKGKVLIICFEGEISNKINLFLQELFKVNKIQVYQL